MALFAGSILIFCGLMLALSVVLEIAARFFVDSGPFTIDVNSGERTLTAEGGNTLLNVLTDNKIFIPSACGGQATCGYCKVRLPDGAAADVLPTEKAFLNRQEVTNGTRLACQVKVRGPLSVRIPQHLLSVRQYTAKVQSAIRVTHDIKELQFKLIDPPTMDYSYGHYIQVSIPDPQEGTISRAYSVSSSIDQKDVVELNVRLHPARGKIPAGKGSTYLHNLNVGDEVIITGPYGEFELDTNPKTELICVGGGAGMAPMKNLILSILEHIPDKPVWLFFGCRTNADVFYLDMFQKLSKKHPQFKVIYALSEKSDQQWDGETGFIHLSVDKYLPDDLRPQQAFLCGPPPMIDAVTEVLLDKNMKPERIFYDKF